jgi:hypothetical protein
MVQNLRLYFQEKAIWIYKLVEKVYLARHQTIPVGRKEYNGSVETFTQELKRSTTLIPLGNS